MTEVIPSLAGMRVLVAEDEFLVAMLLEEMLEDLGCKVAGPYATLAAALDCAKHENYDVAVIDLNLSGEKADPLIAELAHRNVPLAIASGGYDAAKDFQPTTVLDKPYSLQQLEQALNILHDALLRQNTNATDGAANV